MALYKELMQDDGVVTCYHRILYHQTTPNRQTSIVVLSYVNEKAREAEKDNTMAQPYTKAVTYETDYDSAMTDGKAYAYLKTLPIFEGAKDIVDEADTDISGDDFLAMVEEVM